MINKNYYQQLYISQTANFKEIKKAYYKQAKTCHPDLFSNNQDKTEEFKQLVHIFNILSHPQTRESYDLTLIQKTGFLDSNSASIATFNLDSESIMDSLADDIIEEIIVGNKTPLSTSIFTLLFDLQHTENFINCREGQTYFSNKDFVGAYNIFRKLIIKSPLNIIYNYYFGKTCVHLSRYKEATKAFKNAISEGRKRVPRQHLAKVKHELSQIKFGNPKNLLNKLLTIFNGGKGRKKLTSGEDMVKTLDACMNQMMLEDIKRKNKEKKQILNNPPPTNKLIK